eukprot:CAMPEP_0194217906 /NCGR_PEP_ID=MMETSP0156-20130528/22490_1 /TAXON_ID=33649 /ORGANISM="Thalassionema nitzschioides, Strain L26-B" /LENGTH=597 /DNA_ID=CAMNT_0038947069 /DNA_START=22 /DNA_END=1812 /DNA_ORIENTATION=+
MAPQSKETIIIHESPANIDKYPMKRAVLKDIEANLQEEKFHHGLSLSPEVFSIKPNFLSILETPCGKVVVSFSLLTCIPLMAYGSFAPTTGVLNSIIAIWSAWDGLLSIGSLLVLAHTIVGAMYFSGVSSGIPENSDIRLRDCCYSIIKSPTAKSITSKSKTYVFSTRKRLFNTIGLVILLWFIFLTGILGPQSLCSPSWLWHPFLWGRYHVYDMNAVKNAASHICTNKNDLCLNNKEWEMLSAGALSSNNIRHVRAVRNGQMFASRNSIVINVLARNINEHVEALRINIESIAPLFKNVALVVFENDSSDGTREAFKKWSAELDINYTVDLMDCEGVVDCKFKRKYRDDIELEDFDFSSAIGEMHTYRNMAINYIQKDSKYTDFSHLLVLDVDLEVSFSPLGILHTLGVHPDHAVASSGRQPMPTSVGTLIPPYDMNAFREYNTERTIGLELWHKAFCSISAPTERWRSECDALSPVHLIAIVWNERKLISGDFNRVISAFNGAVLYPIDLLRTSGAQYNKGDSGQRCEHVGLNEKMSEHKEMYVNRKWDIHVKPDLPAGPSFARAKKTKDRLMSKPKLMLLILISHLATVGLFVW